MTHNALSNAVVFWKYVWACDAAGLSPVIPWKDARGKARFVCDSMTEGLARQLRLCGFDAASCPAAASTARHRIYRFHSANFCAFAFIQSQPHSQAVWVDLPEAYTIVVTTW